MLFFFFFQAEDGIRDLYVTGVQTCALPILATFDFEEHGIGKRNLVPLADCGKMDEALRVANGNVAKKQRSEERRVGKECRSRWWTCHQKKKKTKREKTGSR